MGPTEPNMASTHDESGASFPDPESFGGPEEFATALFDANAEDGSIGKDRFVGLGHCCFESMCKLNEGPEADVKRMLRGILGPMGEKEKCKDAAKEIVTKVGSEVVPFVAAEIFDWMDQDKDKGVTREELDVAITAAMQGPAAAFGMIFQANMKSVSEAYFDLLDADSDGIIQSNELMAIGGIFDKKTTVDQSFDSLFAMADTDGDGSIDKAESSAFVMKCIALMVSSAKGGVAVYQNVAIAMAGEFFKLLLESVCGGEELTKEQFGELAQGFAEDGPEALMGALMQ